MNVPEDLNYTKDHEWVRVEGEFVVVGIKDFDISSQWTLQNYLVGPKI